MRYEEATATDLQQAPGQLIDAALSGSPVIVTRRGRPVAALVGIPQDGRSVSEAAQSFCVKQEGGRLMSDANGQTDARATAEPTAHDVAEGMANARLRIIARQTLSNPEASEADRNTARQVLESTS